MAVNVRVNQSVVEFAVLNIPNVRVNQSVVEFVTFPFTPPPVFPPIKITFRGVKRTRICETDPKLSGAVEPLPSVKRAM
jgi:hypothetical protein